MENRDKDTQPNIANAHRLDRIEAKIDKLAETVISLARAEEKLINLETSITAIVEKLKIVETKQNIHDKELVEQKSTIGFINRIFWIAFSVITAGLIGSILTLILK